jgi:hypothetical protein
VSSSSKSGTKTSTSYKPSGRTYGSSNHTTTSSTHKGTSTTSSGKSSDPKNAKPATPAPSASRPKGKPNPYLPSAPTFLPGYVR